MAGKGEGLLKSRGFSMSTTATATSKKPFLNIGSGGVHLGNEWENADIADGTDILDLECFGSGWFKKIRASHVLEHLSFKEVPRALEQIMSVLEPGGVLEISVPDFVRIIQIKAHDENWRFYLMGGQTDEHDFHKSVWTVPTLTRALEDAGFEGIGSWRGDARDTSSHACSANLVCRKPEDDLRLPGHRTGAPQESEKIKVVAVMSLPRVSFTDHWGHTIDALSKFNIPIWRSTGVFWGQCMQRLFEKALASGLDWILTIDYDTVFTQEQLDHLIGTFGRNKKIDALCAIQARRKGGTVLAVRKGNTELPIDGGPQQIDTGHFGLTLIRVDALKDLPKPWFASKPDESGGWDEGRIDDDIWFWHQWRENKRTLYMDTGCKVGHLEICAHDFDDNYDHELITVPEWRERYMRDGSNGDG